MWTKEDMDKAESIYMRERPRGYPVRGVLNELMTLAVGLVAARGGTMDPVTLEQNLSGLECGTATTAMVRQHITAQGATVATLQAKVAELERRHEETLEQWSGDRKHANTLALDLGAASSETLRQVALRVRDERDTLRAEVERMKAITSAVEASVVATVGGRVDGGPTNKANYLQRLRELVTAESRLAAIREPLERAESSRRALQDWDQQQPPDDGLDGEAGSSLAELGVALADAYRVLEGDAPNPSMPSNGSGGSLDPTEGLPEPESGVTMRIMSGGAAHEDLQRITGAAPEQCRCADGEPVYCRASRHPCSNTCTHDDAATPGHPERVKERSEDVMATLHAEAAIGRGAERLQSMAYDKGAEAMRAACLSIALNWAKEHGFIHGGEALTDLKHRIEGAAP